jgi:TPR repeat protein
VEEDEGPGVKSAAFFVLALAACTKKESERAAEKVPDAWASSGCDFGDDARCSTECDAGNQGSCVNLAMSIARSDPERARRMLESSCDARSGWACSNLGQLYETGVGVPKEPRRAADYYERACDLGFAGGCGNLGVLVGRGEGRARDPERARSLLRDACGKGDPNACENLRTLR